MRALHVITGLGVGGAEQQLRLLLGRLPAECEVATLTNPGPVAAGLRADGVRVHHLRMGGNRDLAALPRLTGLIGRGGYDLVHTHLYRACVYGRIAARLAGVRAVVATEHSLGSAEIEGRALTRSARALYLATERLGSATVAVSQTVAGRLRDWGVPPSRIHVVPNGIDADRCRFRPSARAVLRTRLGIGPDAFVVGGVGRLVPGKRFDALVRAVAALPDARLLIAGDGPERPFLRSLAASLGAADRVVLLGECDAGAAVPGAVSTGAPGVPEVLSAVDVFVSASREEAFGLAAVEALAAGLPVLHSACPAIEDLPAAASPGALRVDGVPEALTAALRACRAAGIRRLPPPPAVRHYDIAHSAERLMDVYERALAGPHASTLSSPASTTPPTPAPAPTPTPPTSTERART